MLEFEKVTVTFSGVIAVNDVSFAVPDGAITGLLGPNGAGKTTLFNVASGIVRPRAGCVRLQGIDVTNASPTRRAHLGMARTFQRLELFGSLSVFENVLVAANLHRKRLDRSPNDAANEALRRAGVAHLGDVRGDVLPTGTARLVELARALVCAPAVLLLDEPSSGLDREETAEMATLLERLADSGMAVLLVEHDMQLAMRVCSHLHVLDFGRYVTGGSPAEIRANPDVVRAYLGSRAAARLTGVSA